MRERHLNSRHDSLRFCRRKTFFPPLVLKIIKVLKLSRFAKMEIIRFSLFLFQSGTGWMAKVELSPMWANLKWFRCDEILFSMMDCNHMIILNPIIRIRPSNPFPTVPPNKMKKVERNCLHTRKSAWNTDKKSGVRADSFGCTTISSLMLWMESTITSSFNMICAMRNYSVSVETFAIEFR